MSIKYLKVDTRKYICQIYFNIITCETSIKGDKSAHFSINIEN